MSDESLSPDREPNRGARWGRLTWSTLEPLAYLAFCAFCVGYAAHGFFASRAQQLGYALAAQTHLPLTDLRHSLPQVRWSAPLDDVFIHLDFARSWAQGAPLQWFPGSGYSSGATSWLYPPLLSLGFLSGASEYSIGLWVDAIAVAGTLTFVWLARAWFRELPRIASYALPLLVAVQGVLGWSLFSGMELALYLAIFGLSSQYLVQLASGQLVASKRLSLVLLLLVLTRPESLLLVLACAAWLWGSRRIARARGAATRALQPGQLAWLIFPALSITVLRSLLNLWHTGAVADAGALVKLEALHPFLTKAEAGANILRNIGYQFARITYLHSADRAYHGWVLWVLVLTAWLNRRTRARALLLSFLSIVWVLTVAQNEYVRYQNDRYTMPAYVWLLLTAALGLAALLDWSRGLRPTVTPVDVSEPAENSGTRVRLVAPLRRLALALLSLGLLAALVGFQLPRLREQRWFFGRACRNIAEQQIRAGQLLGTLSPAQRPRVFLGDAGAIPLFSHLPAIDGIGLGGTAGLPLARAYRLGVGATIELLQRLPPTKRPNWLALYPSWWDVLPVYFGHPVSELRIDGNVICGAPSKVLYRADFSSLDRTPSPLQLLQDERIVATLDLGDVLSETEHDYQLSSAHSGYVIAKLLPDPSDPYVELFDAGRLTFANSYASFRFKGLRIPPSSRLIVRVAPTEKGQVRLDTAGQRGVPVDVARSEGWSDVSLALPPQGIAPSTRLELHSPGSELIAYHLWLVTKTPGSSARR